MTMSELKNMSKEDMLDILRQIPEEDRSMMVLNALEEGAPLHKIREACRKYGKPDPYAVAWTKCHAAAYAIGKIRLADAMLTEGSIGDWAGNFDSPEASGKTDVSDLLKIIEENRELADKRNQFCGRNWWED